MGAGVSASRRPATPRSAPSDARISPAAGVAALGPPPPLGVTPPRTALLGIFGNRPSRHHLESKISSLVTDLSAAKARVATVERDLQDAKVEADNRGVPRTECVVCMAATVSTVLVPCGHLCLCVACATAMQKSTKESKVVQCPLCRVTVDKMHRVFLPVEQPPPPRPPPLPPPVDDDELDESASPLSGDPSHHAATDAGVQVSPGLRRTPPADAGARYGVYDPRRIEALALGHPLPRAIKRVSVRERIVAANDDDIIMRAPRSIIRPPLDDSAPPRGSPEEAPSSFDFVLPGAYVPATLTFAATWDGSLRARDGSLRAH